MTATPKPADFLLPRAVALFAAQSPDAELQEDQKRLLEILEALPAAIYTTDARGRITYFNRAARVLSGRTPELGRDEWCVSWKLYHPDGRPMAHDACPMAVALREDREVRGQEIMAERPDGTRVPVLPYPTPLHDREGRVIGAVNMLIDISERRQADAAIRENAQKLRVALEAAESGAQALRRANRELERFVSIASHDLKEPLRGIASIAGFIAEDDGPALSEASRARLARINELCQRLSAMVDGLMEYARAGGERSSMPCDLAEIARHAVDKQADGLRELGGGNVRVRLRGPLPTIEGDPVLLERAIANLVANAVKYNDSPLREVEIGPGARRGEVYVRDNGVGIDPRHHDRIFALFRQAPSLSGKGGIGLGLALVKNIVEAHAGSVCLSSTPGEGSTFFLRFRGCDETQECGAEFATVLIAPAHNGAR